ncbi:Transposase [Rhizobium sp. CF142]|nr:Transposase [Rhizobium sp. CF142]
MRWHRTRFERSQRSSSLTDYRTALPILMNAGPILFDRQLRSVPPLSNEAKLAIVAESYAAPRQVTATARHHGITRFQLNAWRKAALAANSVGVRPAKKYLQAADASRQDTGSH